MKVTYHSFKNVSVHHAAGTTDEEILARGGPNAKKLRELRYSFVSMCPDRARGKLFLGCTHFKGDILVEFDLARRKFRSCGFAKSGLLEPYDTKIHKGIAMDPAGKALHFGIATVTPLAQTITSRGGGLIRYEIDTGRFTELARPTRGDFYQATNFDFKREKIYGFTDRGSFVVYDQRRRKLLWNEKMESAPHNGCQDDAGGVWGVHSPGRQAFFRYNPDSNKFEFPGTVFPNAVEASNIMYHGAGPVDSIINGGDGYLYTGSALGELYRIDPRSGDLRYLGKPFPDLRLPALCVGEDGWLYMSGGKSHTSMLARYSREQDRFEYLGKVDHKDGTHLHYAHELVMIDGVIYIGETDNPSRSGYLWACEL